MAKPIDTVQSGVTTIRERRPFVDHLIRAFGRYQSDAGDRLAASVTYFGFLSFFPLIALAFSVAGFVVDAYPDAQQQLTEQINSFLPGLADKLDVTTIGDAKVATGLIGLAGLLFAGLGWIDALREAIRAMWHHNVQAGNVVVKKLVDIAVLGGLGLTLLASVIVTGVSSSAMSWFLQLVGVEDNIVARVTLRIVAIGLAVLVDFAVFLYLFTRLPRLSTPFRRVFKGALLGAVGLEILKVVGSLIVSRTTSNPVYGAFAVIVGLLIWINLVSRFVLFTAAWTVTAPYDTDVPPSGTADPETARKAGIPEQYADQDSSDDPPTTQGDGAPAPLAAAIQGKTPAQDQPAGRVDERPERSRHGSEQTPSPVGADDPYPRGDSGSGKSTSGKSGSGQSGSGDHSNGNSDGRTELQPHDHLVASETSMRTASRVASGVMLAGAATAAIYGARMLRESRADEDD
ncbi:MAG: rane protein [Frankiaceae bacterium]|jgi:membrane protein|nr:rane protein [Frankiaceae bacterium]